MSHAGFYATHFPLPRISVEEENRIKEQLASPPNNGFFTLYFPASSPGILRETSFFDNTLQTTDFAVYIGAPTAMMPSGPRVERMCELSPIDAETSEYSPSSYYGIVAEHKELDVSTCTDPNFIFKINQEYFESAASFIHPTRLLAPAQAMAASASSGSMLDAWSAGVGAGTASGDPGPHA